MKLVCDTCLQQCWILTSFLRADSKGEIWRNIFFSFPKHSDRLAWVVAAGEWGDWSRPGTQDVNGQPGEFLQSNLACPPPRQIWPGQSEPGNIRKAAKAWKRKRGIFLDVMHAPGEIESLMILNILSPDLVMQDWFKRYHWWNPTQTWPGGRQFEVWLKTVSFEVVKSFKLHVLPTVLKLRGRRIWK